MVLGSGCDFLQGKHAREATTRPQRATHVVLRTHQATRGHKRGLFMPQATTDQERVIVFGQSAGDPFHLKPQVRGTKIYQKGRRAQVTSPCKPLHSSFGTVCQQLASFLRKLPNLPGSLLTDVLQLVQQLPRPMPPLPQQSNARSARAPKQLLKQLPSPSPGSEF